MVTAIWAWTSTACATLQPLGNTQFIYTADTVLTEFNGDLGTGTVMNPQRVRLITADGRTIDFERQAGLTRIQDRNANTLSITPGGLLHSAGTSIAFQRDSAGRITRTTDPLGHTTEYAYDASGDLMAFTDQSNTRTTFIYDQDHHLGGDSRSPGTAGCKAGL